MKSKDKIHIIAEIGNNHNGSIEIAKELIDVAVSAGADSVKFQAIYPEGLYIKKLVTKDGYDENPIIGVRQKSKLSDSEYNLLNDYCLEKNIAFSSSVFDRQGILLLNELKVPYIKIASTDLNNLSLLDEAASTGRRLIISTGFSYLNEIEKSVDFLQKRGFSDIVLLHCVSVYPAPVSLMNLNFIDELKSNFDCPIGFSDHTESHISAIISVGKNISFIEKHVTLDKKQEGFDHPYATEPSDFIEYVKQIRLAETANNFQTNKLSDEEKSVKERARRGIYFKRSMGKGEKITFEDLLIVRPPNSFSADQVYEIVGKRLNLSKIEYSPVEIGDLEMD